MEGSGGSTEDDECAIEAIFGEEQIAFADFEGHFAVDSEQHPIVLTSSLDDPYVLPGLYISTMNDVGAESYLCGWKRLGICLSFHALFFGEPE